MTGAVESTVQIHDHDVIEIAYVPNCLRVKVKAIGALDAIPQEPLSPPSPLAGPKAPPRKEQGLKESINPHWPNSSAEDAASDIAANLAPPNIQGKDCSSHAVLLLVQFW